MTALTQFAYEGRTVRTTVIDGEPWFVAADVCNILGYLNARDAVAKHVPAQLRRVSRFATPLSNSGFADLTVITEAGLYRLIMRSNATGAAPFQAWVTEEVLPAIRKTGRYEAAPQFEIPASYAEALELAARQARELDAAEAKVAELEPAATSWQQLADASGDYSLREAAEILSRDPAITTGQNRLASYLREIGWVDSKPRSLPYQRHIDAGRLAVRVTPYVDKDTGEDCVSRQIRVTVKGLHELHRQLGGCEPLPTGRHLAVVGGVA